MDDWTDQEIARFIAACIVALFLGAFVLGVASTMGPVQNDRPDESCIYPMGATKGICHPREEKTK